MQAHFVYGGRIARLSLHGDAGGEDRKKRPGPRPAPQFLPWTIDYFPSGTRWSKKMPKSATLPSRLAARSLGSNCCCFKTIASAPRGTALGCEASGDGGHVGRVRRERLTYKWTSPVD